MGVITRGQKTVNVPMFQAMGICADPKIAFGERLRQLRKVAGLSQEGLAHRADLDRSYVGAVERGEVNISVMNICILAEAIGVHPKELLDFPNDCPSNPKRKSKRAR
jgi:transcriptional regulator with XRE-family HTH domain